MKYNIEFCKGLRCQSKICFPWLIGGNVNLFKMFYKCDFFWSRIFKFGIISVRVLGLKKDQMFSIHNLLCFFHCFNHLEMFCIVTAFPFTDFHTKIGCQCQHNNFNWSWNFAPKQSFCSSIAVHSNRRSSWKPRLLLSITSLLAANWWRVLAQNFGANSSTSHFILNNNNNGCKGQRQ